MSIVGIAVSIFLVFNVLGNIPFFISILKPYSERRKNMILLRELLIALVILLMFGYFGDNIMSFLGITQGIIGIAGGILLLLISLTMIFPKHEMGGMPMHEPMIVPIAIPVMAGPGSITAVMVYSHQVPNEWYLTLAIILAWIPSFLIVMAASYIKYLVGEKGLIAFERFGGLLVSLISIQMITSGAIQLVKDNFEVAEKKPMTVYSSPPQTLE